MCKSTASTEYPTSLPSVIFQRNMLAIYGASFIVMIILMLSFTMFPLYVVERGGSDFTVGLHNSLFTIFAVIFRFYLGPLADKKGRKLPLLIGVIVFATTPPAVFLSPNLIVMGIVRVYQAVGLATYLSAASSFVADISPKQYRGAAIGIYRMVITISLMVGPAVGYEIITRLGFGIFFMATAFIGGISIILILLLSDQQTAKEGITKTVSAQDTISTQDILGLFSIPALRITYMAIIISSIAYGIILSFVSLFAAPYIANPSVFFTLFAITGALASFFIGYLSDFIGRKPLILPVTLSFVLGLILISRLPFISPLFFWIGALLGGVGFYGGLTLYIAWIVDTASDNLRASALAFQESAIDGGMGIGALVFGALAVYFSFSQLFLGLGLFILLIPIIAFFLHKNG